MDECIFCKIVNGELPSFKVYEDEDIFAFLDLRPVHPGHTLIIPKKHSVTVLDTDEEVLKKLMVATKKIAKAVYESLEIKGFNITFCQFEVGGQTVPHLHAHIIPRYEGDGLKFWPSREYESDDHKKEIQEKITRLLK
tara:strand:- start:1262 stop:1675 length:414 start_codon:yes stop_codon:yes gene_type:complete